MKQCPMSLSLLTIRKHLRPLAWLLGIALLVSASPHLAQGLVLCIGEDHVEVEAFGTGHHAGDAAEEAGAFDAEVSAAALDASIEESSALRQSDAPCIDVPLRAARADDPCHQAVSARLLQAADVLLAKASLPAVALLLGASASAASDAPTHPLPSSEVPAASSLRALSSVVLLI